MFEQAFKNIDDVLWKEAGCTTELDYTEQSSWLLFPKYLGLVERSNWIGKAVIVHMTLMTGATLLMGAAMEVRHG